ncbi:hypothetical protein QJS04_geneDACA018056 [Acorus gramineus]|uniref:Uncharacterized protein n=1 Tax=Acorus gramineus TaxID=55184 RepID=A0AAV9A946_ACOGR|nr:hypothetical protein QJS04_geneDACA018056 [Acorus gramineus]
MKPDQEAMKAEEATRAQAQVWRHIYSFAESMMLKCAIELRIADALDARRGAPMSLTELASAIATTTGSGSPDLDRLARIMRYLVHMDLFGVTEDGEYVLTPASELLVRGRERSLASFALLQYYEMDAWGSLSEAVEGEATPWERRHGIGYREYFAKDTKANKLLSEAMTSHTSMVTEALVRGCEKGRVLEGFASLVDLGGSTGVAARAIAKAFPRLKCSVFDLPHVVANAPECAEVERVEGDMFVEVPKADVVFMKSVLHDWDDEDCIKILKKCKEAIPAEKGKVVVVDIVMDVEEEEATGHDFTSARLGMDMDMLVTVGGRERAKAEWERLFKAAGFHRCEFTPIAAIESIIEVYP